MPQAVSERRDDGRVEVFSRDLARSGRFQDRSTRVPYDAWTLADGDGRVMDVLLWVPAWMAPFLHGEALPPPKVR